MVQWLGLSTFTAGTQVQSLVGELRFHKPGGYSQKKNKKTRLRFASTSGWRQNSERVHLGLYEIDGIQIARKAGKGLLGEGATVMGIGGELTACLSVRPEPRVGLVVRTGKVEGLQP